MSNKKQEAQAIGNTSELAVMLEYSKRGYTINIPTAPARYDFIGEKEGRTVKVQVKHGSSFNNERELLGYSKTPYSKKDIDVVTVYDSTEDKIYYIPVDHVSDMTSIRLRKEPYLYNVPDGKALIASHYEKFIG